MTAWRISGRRVWTIARMVVKTAVRQRLIAVFLLLALLLGAVALVLRDLDFGQSEAAFLTDCGFGVMALLGAALAMVLTTQSVVGEVEQRTAFPLFAKPVTRADFVLGKFLGLAVLLGAFCALIALLMAVVIVSRPEIVSTLPTVDRPTMTSGEVFIGTCRQWLKLTVLVALMLLVAAYARTQLLVTMTGTVLWLGGHLHSLADDAVQRSESVFVRFAGQIATGWLPDFSLFAARPEPGVAAASLSFLSLYAAGYVLIGCGLAVICLRHREL